MKIINAYVLKMFLRYLIICLAVLVFIYVIINLFDNLGKFLARNVSGIDIFIYYLYLTPSYIVLLIPVATIMAVFFVFGIMTKNNEMLALKTGGMDINQLFFLLLETGLVIVLFTFIFQETVGTWAQTKMFEHKRAKIDKRPIRKSMRRSNFFYYGEDNWVYFIKSFDGNSKTLNHLTLWKISRKDQKIKKRIDAIRGFYQNGWVLESVTVREFDSSGNEKLNVYPRLTMPELKEKPEDFLRRIKPLEEMNFLELIKFVKKRSRAGQDVVKERVELNYRFSYPLITLIVLLIVLPISVVLKKGGIAIGLGISIVLAFVYWGVIQSCRAYGVAGLMDPITSAWLPNIIFGILGGFLMLRVKR